MPGGGIEFVSSTTTDGDGLFRFFPIPEGQYWVEEVQPSGFTDGVNESLDGTVQGDFLAAVTVGAGLESSQNFFHDIRSATPAPGALSGYVAGEDSAGVYIGNLPGVTVELRTPNSAGGTDVAATTVTDSNGLYRFADLAPGQYWVRQVQPAGYDDGEDFAGSTGGTPQEPDFIAAIPVATGAESSGNNFTDRQSPVPPPVPPTAPGALSGKVFVDANNNGVKDDGEPGVRGVRVNLRAPNLAGSTDIFTSTTTDGNGDYRFGNLTPGNYWVQEVQPRQTLDGKDTPGNTGGVSQELDFLSAVPVSPGVESSGNNFGERDGTRFAIASAGDLQRSTQVLVHDGGDNVIATLTPYPGFALGVNVATGDVTGDGIEDIVTAAGLGGGPHVKVFDGNSFAEIGSFLAYAQEFNGGVNVAVGDTNGDGFDEIITGASFGGGPHVKIFTAGGAELNSFFAFNQGLRNGVSVAAGDVNGDGRDEIVFGAGEGGGPHVKVLDLNTVTSFDGGGQVRDSDLTATFFAFDQAFTGGVSVAAGDTNGDGKAEVIVGQRSPGVALPDKRPRSTGHLTKGSGGTSGGERLVRTFDGGGTQLSQFKAFNDADDPLNVSGGAVSVAALNRPDGTTDLLLGTLKENFTTRIVQPPTPAGATPPFPISVITTELKMFYAIRGADGSLSEFELFAVDGVEPFVQRGINDKELPPSVG